MKESLPKGWPTFKRNIYVTFFLDDFNFQLYLNMSRLRGSSIQSLINLLHVLNNSLLKIEVNLGEKVEVNYCFYVCTFNGT